MQLFSKHFYEMRNIGFGSENISNRDVKVEVFFLNYLFSEDSAMV